MPRSRKPSEPARLRGCNSYTIRQFNLNERKSYATCYPLPKPVALPQELQTKSCHSNPTGTEAELRVTPDACRSSKQNVVMNTETQSRTMANVAFLD